jgi:hypothetical protein
MNYIERKCPASLLTWYEMEVEEAAEQTSSPNKKAV